MKILTQICNFSVHIKSKELDNFKRNILYIKKKNVQQVCNQKTEEIKAKR